MATPADIARYGVEIDASEAKKGVDAFLAGTDRMERGAVKAEASIGQMESAIDSAARHMVVSQQQMRDALDATNGDLSAAAKLVADQTRAHKEAAAAAAKAVPPDLVPPNVPPDLNRVTDAIKRMRAAALEAGIARHFQQAEQQAARLAHAVNGVAAAQQRMRQAAAQRSDTAMAGQIARLDPFQQAASAEKSAISMNKLQSAMTTLAVASGALPAPLARVGSILGSFALGGGIMVGVLAGIAALSFAWDKATESSRKAREEFEKHIEVLKALKREQDLGVGGEAGAATSAVQAELARRRAELQELNRQISAGAQFTGAAGGVTVGTGGLEARRRQLIKEYAAMAELAKAGEKKVTSVISEELEKRQQEAERRFMEQNQHIRSLYDARIEMERQLAQGIAKHLARIADAMDAVRDAKRRAFDDDSAEFWKKQNTDLEQIIRNVRKFLDGLDEANQKAKEMQQLISGAWGGLFAGAVQQSGGPFGGVLGGAVSAIIGGGNAMAVAAGAAQGLAQDLIGLATAGAEARERMRQLQLSYDTFTEAMRVQLGLMTSLEANTNAVNREFEAFRREQGLTTQNASELTRQLGSTNPVMRELAEQRLEALKSQLGEVSQLEALRIQQLLEQAEAERQRVIEVNIAMQQDIEVRRARALGRTEEADALAFALQQQREYADAVRAGADATTLAALAEVQRLEKIARAIEQTQTKIDAFTATIASLEGFRDSILLADAGGLSPTAALEEARRQYETVLAAAMGGDQSAAGRLPGAAQALLEASRAVNASGPAFQADFQKILADTQAVIQKFQDLRSIEELMLAELIQIRDNTSPTRDGTIDQPSGGRGTFGNVVEELQAQIAVSQEGFARVVSRLETLTDRVDAVESTTRDSFDGIRAVLT